jgi:hypothetical protein
MLAFLRKHQYGILLVVAVLVIIAFTFWGDFTSRGRNPADVREGKALTVLDTTFPPEEVDEINRTYRALANLQSADPRSRFADPIFMHVMTVENLSRQVVNMDEQEGRVPTDFLLNTAIIRTQARQLGVSASEAACEEFIQTLPRFQDPKTGKFDPTLWSTFKDAYGGSTGARVRDIYAAVSDIIIFDRLFDLIGGEFPPSKTEVDWAYASRHQKINSNVISFAKKAYENPEVTDEEIKAYYEKEKDSPELMSEEKRSLHYVLVPKPTEAELKDLGDAQKEEKQKEHKKKAHDFANQLVEENRKPFAEIAKGLGLEVRTTEPFSRATPPADMKDEPQVVDLGFDLAEVGQADVAPGAKGYYAVEVAAIEKQKPLDFDAAKEKITTILKEQKQEEKLKQAVAEARTKIKADLDAGKPIADAVKAAGVEAREVPVFSQMKPLTGEPNYDQIRSAAGSLNAGELSDPLDTPDGRILVYIAKKELPKDPKMEDQKRSIANEFKARAQRAMSNPVFLAWFSDLKRRVIAGRGQS